MNLFYCLPFIAMGQTSEFNYATGNVTGKSYVGGLTGGISGTSAMLRNSYARGSVTGESMVGGLAGNNNGSVINSYSTGLVNGTTQAGGLVGSGNGVVTNSYWDTQTSGQLSSIGGTPQTTDPLTYPYSAGIYTGWDFTSVWKADNDPKQNDGYPLLQPSAVYLVSVQVYPPGSGTATGAGYVKTYGQVQLDAAPISSYVFKGWIKNGTVISTNTRFSMAVSENTDLVARFESKTTAISTVQVQPSSGIRIYPNPVKDILHIDVTSAGKEIRSVQLVNINGQVVRSYRADQLHHVQCAFPVSELSPGVYMVVIKFASGYQAERFVKY